MGTPPAGAEARLLRLGAACAACFTGQAAPDAARVAAVAAAMDAISAEDLGLAPVAPPRSSVWSVLTRAAAAAGFRGAPTATDAASSQIKYLPLSENAACTVGVFCLPAGAVIPLHDHPGMTVLSRLLYGELHVRALDWAPGAAGGAAGGAALVAGERVSVGPAPAALLHPVEGNVHAFTARTPCAVLDVLGPPYSAREGRDCTYLAESEPGTPAGQRTLLRSVPPPPQLRITRGVYSGPPMEVARL